MSERSKGIDIEGWRGKVKGRGRDIARVREEYREVKREVKREREGRRYS